MIISVPYNSLQIMEKDFASIFSNDLEADKLCTFENCIYRKEQ
jgi:hypothetical protein